MAAEACPDRVALSVSGSHFTYSQLYHAAKNAAVRFRANKCKYVALLDISSPAVPAALFGAAMAGIPYVPLNYRLASEDLQALLKRVSPAFLIVADAYQSQLDGLNIGTVVDSDEFVKSLLQASEVEALPEPESDIAVQLFTSGTTGTPKAALLKHDNLVSYILGSVEFMGAEENEAALSCVPPYHIAGISAVLSSVYSCRRQVQLPDFSPKSWIAQCRDQSVTQAFVVPTMLTRIISCIEDSDEEANLGSLRSLAYGGGRMPLEVIERALELLPDINYTNAYGLTETSSTISILGPEDHKRAITSDKPEDKARLSSVGQPLPSLEVEIRDVNGKAVPTGVEGEVCVRGPQVSGQYKEKSVIGVDGWFPTRDAGYLDEGGYLFLSGRIDDVIVRGGENMSPGEIEDVLRTHNDVIDVGVVGIPSEEWGEAVAAAVVTAADSNSCDAKDLCALVKSRLRSSKVPEKIIFVDELPYNEMGKLLRRELKKAFA